MKAKIVEIIGEGIGTIEAELKASQIMLLFNQRIVNALKKRPMIIDLSEFANEIFIKL